VLPHPPPDPTQAAQWLCRLCRDDWTVLVVDGARRAQWRRGRAEWKDLSPRTHKVIIASAAGDGTPRIVALVDRTRPSSQIRGSKAAWPTTIPVLNSVGTVPILYLTRGTRR